MLQFDIRLAFTSGSTTTTDVAGGFAAIEARITSGLREIIAHAAKRLHEEADREASLPKSGIHHPGQPNRSSAPGEAPAKQTGNLLASITDQFARDGLEVTVGPTVDYAVYLHHGLGGNPDNARPIMTGPLKTVGEEVTASIIALVRGS